MSSHPAREVPEGFKGAWFNSKRTNLRHNITSTYFEGEKAELSALGYSRDKRPEKKQVTIGIATGLTSNRFINIWEPNNQ